MTSVLIKGKFGHRHTGRRPCEDEGRALQAKDCQMLSANCQELGAWYTFSLMASERTQSAKTLISNSGFQNSETIVSVVSATYFVVLCYDSSSDGNSGFGAEGQQLGTIPKPCLAQGREGSLYRVHLGPDNGHLSSCPCGKKIPNPPRSSPVWWHRVKPR